MTEDLPPMPEPAYEAYYYTADQMCAYAIAYGDARAAAAVAQEWERCALICESRITPGTGSVAILNGAAAAIRSSR